MTKNIGQAYEKLRTKVSSVYSATTETAKRMNKWLESNPQWISAALVIVIGIAIAEWMEEKYAFLDLRYKGYALTESLAARIKDDLYDHHTVLVLIEDDEYWVGDYQGRSPINKTHLGELVAALDEYKPKVIALDFNFTSPVADGRILEHGPFKKETEDLTKALCELKSKPKIILPKTLGIDDGFYRADSTVYDKSKVGGAQFGYIDLPPDYRMIPPSLPLKDGHRLYSFSEAVVHEFDVMALRWDRNDEPKCYASGFLSEEQFMRYSATEAQYPDEHTRADLARDVFGNIVIIGGAWSRDAYGRGKRVDTRDTPVGPMPAIFLHAAWIESMLATRTARPMGNLAKWTLELLAGFLTYYVFTRNWFSRKRNYLFRIVYLFVLVGAWLVTSYVSSQNLGIFFDPVIPSIASIGKAAYEQIDVWRVGSNLHEEYKRSLVPPPSKEVLK